MKLPIVLQTVAIAAVVVPRVAVAAVFHGLLRALRGQRRSEDGARGPLQHEVVVLGAERLVAVVADLQLGHVRRLPHLLRRGEVRFVAEGQRVFRGLVAVGPLRDVHALPAPRLVTLLLLCVRGSSDTFGRVVRHNGIVVLERSGGVLAAGQGLGRVGMRVFLVRGMPPPHVLVVVRGIVYLRERRATQRRRTRSRVGFDGSGLRHGGLSVASPRGWHGAPLEALGQVPEALLLFALASLRARAAVAAEPKPREAIQGARRVRPVAVAAIAKPRIDLRPHQCPSAQLALEQRLGRVQHLIAHGLLGPL